MQGLTKQGKFCEAVYSARSDAGPWDRSGNSRFSMDENQKFLFVDDGENNVIWTVLPRRRNGRGPKWDTAGAPRAVHWYIRSSPTRKATSTQERSTPANDSKNLFCCTRIGIAAETKLDFARAMPSQAKSVGPMTEDGTEAHRGGWRAWGLSSQPKMG